MLLATQKIFLSRYLHCILLDNPRHDRPLEVSEIEKRGRAAKTYLFAAVAKKWAVHGSRSMAVHSCQNMVRDCGLHLYENRSLLQSVSLYQTYCYIYLYCNKKNHFLTLINTVRHHLHTILLYTTLLDRYRSRINWSAPRYSIGL